MLKNIGIIVNGGKELLLHFYDIENINSGMGDYNICYNSARNL